MARPILLMRFEGPLQSWGSRSRWDVRDTQPEPTKSGVMGLLGCALGYPVRDARLETVLDAGLRFGVRVEHPGRVVKDYQTISGFLPTAEGTFRHSGVKTAASLTRLRADPDVVPATIVSPRYYLEDASFLIALEENSGFTGLLEECAAALRDPKWPIFLGRKACVPTRPIFENLTDRYDSLEDALRQYPWSWLGACNHRRTNGPRVKPRAYVERVDGRLIRQDAIRINRARVYGFRHSDEVDGIEPEREESDVSIQD